MTCPSCSSIFTKTTPREMASDLDEEEDGVRSGRKKNALPANSPGRDALGFEPFVESRWLHQSDNDPEFSLAPSSKTSALKATLLRGFDKAPMDKVFSLSLTHFPPSPSPIHPHLPIPIIRFPPSPFLSCV